MDTNVKCLNSILTTFITHGSAASLSFDISVLEKIKTLSETLPQYETRDERRAKFYEKKIKFRLTKLQELTTKQFDNESVTIINNQLRNMVVAAKLLTFFDLVTNLHLCFLPKLAQTDIELQKELNALPSRLQCRAHLLNELLNVVRDDVLKFIGATNDETYNEEALFTSLFIPDESQKELLPNLGDFLKKTANKYSLELEQLINLLRTWRRPSSILINQSVLNLQKYINDSQSTLTLAAFNEKQNFPFNSDEVGHYEPIFAKYRSRVLKRASDEKLSVDTCKERAEAVTKSSSPPRSKDISFQFAEEVTDYTPVSPERKLTNINDFLEFENCFSDKQILEENSLLNCRRTVLMKAVPYDVDNLTVQKHVTQFGRVDGFKWRQRGKYARTIIIIYKSADMVETFMQRRPHVFGKQSIEVQRRLPKDYHQNDSQISRLAMSINHSNAYKKLTLDDLRGYFREFGELSDTYIHWKDEPNVAYIDYVDYDSVDKALLNGEQHSIHNTEVHLMKDSAPFWVHIFDVPQNIRATDLARITEIRIAKDILLYDNLPGEAWITQLKDKSIDEVSARESVNIWNRKTSCFGSHIRFELMYAVRSRMGTCKNYQIGKCPYDFQCIFLHEKGPGKMYADDRQKSDNRRYKQNYESKDDDVFNEEWLCQWTSGCYSEVQMQCSAPDHKRKKCPVCNRHELDDCSKPWGKKGVYYSADGTIKDDWHRISSVIQSKDLFTHNHNGCTLVHILVFTRDFKTNETRVMFGLKRKKRDELIFPSIVRRKSDEKLHRLAKQLLTSLCNQSFPQNTLQHRILFFNANVVYPIYLNNEHAQQLIENFQPLSGNIHSLKWFSVEEINQDLPQLSGYLHPASAPDDIEQVDEDRIKMIEMRLNYLSVGSVTASLIFFIANYIPGGWEEFLQIPY